MNWPSIPDNIQHRLDYLTDENPESSIVTLVNNMASISRSWVWYSQMAEMENTLFLQQVRPAALRRLPTVPSRAKVLALYPLSFEGKSWKEQQMLQCYMGSKLRDIELTP
jgi:hypothetical protein